MFNYATVRFQLLPGSVARVLEKNAPQLQRWAGACDDALAVGAVDLDSLRDKLVAHVFGEDPPEDAGVQLSCADAASTEVAPGTPYARVWSDSLGPEYTREIDCALALTPSERGRLRALLGQLATHAGCPDHANEPPPKLSPVTP